MRAENFNSVPKKKHRRKLVELTVIPSIIEVFVCAPLNGARLRREACAKISSNPPTTGPCRDCSVGKSHAKGRVPMTWPDGTDIVTKIVRVGTIQ